MLFVLSIILILTYWVNILYGMILATLIVLLLILNGIGKNNLSLNYKDSLFFLYSTFAIFPVLSGKEEVNLFIKIIIYPWLLTFIFQNLDINYNKTKVLFSVIIISAAVVSIIMFFQAGPKQFEFNLDYILTKDRNYGFYFLDADVKLGPTTIAAMLSVVVVGILAFIKYKIFSPVLGWIVFAAFAILLLIAGGRSSIIATLFALFLFYIKSSKKSFSKILFQIVVLLFFIFLVSQIFVFISGFQSEMYYNRFLFFENYNSDSAIITRFILWGSALDLISTNPMGIGYHKFFDKFGLTTHNEYLAQILGAGYIGSFMYFLLIILVGVQLVKKVFLSDGKVTSFKNYFAISIYIVAVFSMVSENISVSSQNIFYPIFWITVGIYFNKYGMLDEKSIN